MEELIAALELILTLSFPENQTEAQKTALRNLFPQTNATLDKALLPAPFTDKELATVLAALRYWQVDVLQIEGAKRGEAHFHDHDPLTSAEVDELCERLNCEKT